MPIDAAVLKVKIMNDFDRADYQLRKTQNNWSSITLFIFIFYLFNNY